MNRPDRITVQSDDEAREVANAEKSVKASPSGNGRRQNDAKPSVKHAGLNRKKRRRASWKNGNCAKTAMSPSASGVLACARVASMRYVSTKNDSLPTDARGRLLPIGSRFSENFRLGRVRGGCGVSEALKHPFWTGLSRVQASSKRTVSATGKAVCSAYHESHQPLNERYRI